MGLIEASLNFEKTKEIGQEGKNSNVYIAHDKQFDADIIIKQIDKESFKGDSNKYFSEAKCLYASKHQNVVEVNYSCEDEDYVYIAMPYYPNGSLQALIKEKFLTVREIIKYSVGFLSGLNHIHTKGLIHFDIKPTNILISNSDEALLTDFGLAKFTNDERVAKQDLFYMRHRAPETLLTDTFTIQTDIYQAGITLYRLCNESLFINQLYQFSSIEELYKAISKGIFPNRNTFSPHIPKKLRNIIKKAIHVDPTKRFNNVIEMLNQLARVNEHLDWKYQITDNKQIWKLAEENKSYEVILSKDGEEFNIDTNKTMYKSKNTTKEQQKCYKHVKEKEVSKIIIDILGTYN